MSRISIPARLDSPVASQPMLDAVDKQMGTVPNLFRLMGISPAVLKAYLGLGDALGHSLDGRTRERIAITVPRSMAATIACRPTPISVSIWPGSTQPKSRSTARAIPVTPRRMPRWCSRPQSLRPTAR